MFTRVYRGRRDARDPNHPSSSPGGKRSYFGAYTFSVVATALVVACAGSDDTSSRFSDDDDDTPAASTGTGDDNATSGTGTDTTVTTTDPPGEECGPWPSGTPGLEVGETIPERSWVGLRPGSTTEETFELAEFRKCGGGGVDVLIIDTSSYT
ncbi:MAG: hypothetical protein AAGA56_25050 [Myxococcota bacterium]